MTDSTVQRNDENDMKKRKRENDPDKNKNLQQEYNKLLKKYYVLHSKCNELSTMKWKDFFKVFELKNITREIGSRLYDEIEKTMIDATLDLRNLAMCHYGFFPNTVVPKLDKIVKYWHQIFDKRIIKRDENGEELITKIEQKQLWLLCLILIAALTNRKLEYKRTDKEYYDMLVPLCVKFENLFKDQQDNDFGCFQIEMIKTYIVDVFGKCLSTYFNTQTLELLKNLKFYFDIIY